MTRIEEPSTGIVASLGPGSGLKGLPFGSDAGSGWGVFDAELGFPVALLKESAILHNSATMAAFCARHRVSLAPHGKTTMAPTLFGRQLDDGAWGISAATVWQAKTMYEAGVRRVLIANQVVVPAEIEWLAMAGSEGFEVVCYVDSLAGVEIMEETLSRSGSTLRVLVEIGVPGGRTGARTLEDAIAVAEAASASPHLALTGVSGFEGILGPEGDRPASEVVAAFLDRVVELATEVYRLGLFEPSPEVIVTAGGSAYFDHVVDRFSHVDVGDLPLRKIIRSGGYISHDDVGLHRVSPMGAVPRTEDGATLLPAIEVWGAVLSRPDPTRALVGLGKRDASPDGRLPLAKKVRRRGSSIIEDIEPIQAISLNDQHTFLDLPADDPLAVGDLVGFGIGHPCTTFDKWRVLLMVDDDYQVTQLVHTLF